MVKFPSLRGAAQQPITATEHPEEALRRVPQEAASISGSGSRRTKGEACAVPYDTYLDTTTRMYVAVVP